MRPLHGKGPAAVSPLLLRVIGQLMEKEGVSSDRLAEAVAGLSRLFTKERAGLNRPYFDNPASATAYLRYFFPVNFSKVQILLDEMPAEPAGAGLSVLDLGSGPGTGALAVLDRWHHRGPASGGALSVVAVDHAQAALRQAAHLWEHYCRAEGIHAARLSICEGDVTRSAKGLWQERVRQEAPYDLVILANSLNELFADAQDPITARTGLIAELLALLAPHGTVMIVEPALRETSRALHQLRDRLLEAGGCNVYSPCLHERSCPALVNPDDWCHEERVWDAPAAIQEIDEAVGFIKDALKFSYLLLRKDGKTIVERRLDVYRIVSELRELKGEKRAWLCNEQGRQEVGRQDRLASPENAGFDRWHRGAIVQIERIVRKEKDGKVSALGRIEQDAAVRIIRSV